MRVRSIKIKSYKDIVVKAEVLYNTTKENLKGLYKREV